MRKRVCLDIITQGKEDICSGNDFQWMTRIIGNVNKQIVPPEVFHWYAHTTNPVQKEVKQSIATSVPCNDVPPQCAVGEHVRRYQSFYVTALL